MMAAATLMLLPVLAIYFFSQRAVMQGLVISGVKGLRSPHRRGSRLLSAELVTFCEFSVV